MDQEQELSRANKKLEKLQKAQCLNRTLNPTRTPIRAQTRTRISTLPRVGQDGAVLKKQNIQMQKLLQEETHVLYIYIYISTHTHTHKHIQYM